MASQKNRFSAAEYVAQFGGGLIVGSVGRAPKAQIRIPKQSGPNKTEREWMERCANLWPGAKVLYEPMTLKLPSGTRYTPDVVVVAASGEIKAIYEVKGAHIHNARSKHAYKEAVAAFPFWSFQFAQKTKAGWAVR